MSNSSMKAKKMIIFLFVLISIYSAQALAAIEHKITFSVKALFKDRALIEINGTPHVLSAGEQSPEGVKLLSSDVDVANIYCHGKKYSLYINQTAYALAPLENKKPKFKAAEFEIPVKMVPGKALPSIQTNENGMIKYMLKDEYNNPSLMKYGQDAIWIGAGKKILRFDIKKEAWGEFDLSNRIEHGINSFSVSDKSVILNVTKKGKNKKNEKHYGLFLLNTRTRELHQQLNTSPGNYEFIGEKLWFLDSYKGLGYLYPKKNKKNVKYSDALLYKEKKKNKEKDKRKNTKNERAYILSFNGDDIWYSHRTKFKKNNKKRRLNEICVSHYNKKYKTLKRITRKEMGLNPKYNCSHLALSKEQIWLSHERENAGLSVFNTSTKRWKHILASTNNMSLGGNIIMLNNDRLWMINSNQLIALNTKTLHADVILGDAVITSSWRSSFYVKDDYAWYATKESTNNKLVKSRLVLYKIPVNSAVMQTDLSQLN